jgi:serine/threonine-protein kinase
MGTPSYMSPEQVKGRAVDGRSDIFSLGVMLYEMVTGEKPFPGQNITTVIYKIVNEEPVPPRQINPSIHAGISTVVMRALEKDPDQRYQSCREMLEDLRNYRSIAPAGNNPQSTMVLGGGSPSATLISANPGGRGFGGEDQSVAAMARSLSGRASTPGQTPIVRRTGAIASALEPPKKKSVFGTILAALLLLGVIVYGADKIRPVFEAARVLYDEQKKGGDLPPAVPAGSENASANPAENSAGTENSSLPKDPAAGTGAEPKPAETKPAAIVPEKAAPRKPENSISTKAAEYKGRIEEAISEKGLNGHVKVQAAGNTLTLAGKLHPAEHGALLKLLRNAPSDVRVIDHLEYDDTPVPAAGGSDQGTHPVPGAGRGAIHVVTDVIGATAVLRGTTGNVLNKCETPCSFNNLSPSRYSLEVQKDGYQSVQTALQVKSGDAQDQKIKLESLAKGIFISTQPPGADVFINGAKQSGQTPVTLPLAAGQYNLVLRLQGYQPYSGPIQVKDNIQTQLNVPLNAKSASRIAWAQVNSVPKSAEIILDGVSTGQFTPARIQIPTGMHTVTLRLNGFQQAKRTFQASEGGTVPIDEALHEK